jgi:hypothetical protein
MMAIDIKVTAPRDLRSYRTLLAQSDDLNDSGHEAVRLAQAK